MKRGQSSLEYLMTYAWSILLVLVVIGVLNYLGVLNVYAILPTVCLTKAGFSCEDFQIKSDGTATIVIRNAQIKSLQDYGVIINGVPGACPILDQWKDGKVIACNFQDLEIKEPGSPFKGTLVILFRYKGSTINHEIGGRVFSKYEN